MKISLLAIIPVVLLLHKMKGDLFWVDHYSQPCQNRSSNITYNNFVHRHILNRTFDTTNWKEWESYLEEKKLCNRTHQQSFIDAEEGQVSQVCRTSGMRVVNGGNLCISKSSMRVYHVMSSGTNNTCKVTNVTEGNHKVVLACNKVPVRNQCLPVHYQKWRNQTAGNQTCNES